MGPEGVKKHWDSQPRIVQPFAYQYASCLRL